MKLQSLLFEEAYKMFRTYMYVEFDDSNMDVSTLANIIRGLPQVAVVNNKSDKEDTRPRALFQVKISTVKPPSEAFSILEQDVRTKISEVKKCQISERHVEEVNL